MEDVKNIVAGVGACVIAGNGATGKRSLDQAITSAVQADNTKKVNRGQKARATTGMCRQSKANIMSMLTNFGLRGCSRPQTQTIVRHYAPRSFRSCSSMYLLAKVLHNNVRAELLRNTDPMTLTMGKKSRGLNTAFTVAGFETDTFCIERAPKGLPHGVKLICTINAAGQSARAFIHPPTSSRGNADRKKFHLF